MLIIRVKKSQLMSKKCDGQSGFLTCVAACSKVSMTASTFIWPDTHLIFLAGEVAFTESLGEEEMDNISQTSDGTTSHSTCADKYQPCARYIRVRHSSPSCPHPRQHANPGDLEKRSQDWE